MLDAPESILGIPKSADIDQINAAYRKLARTHHPDMGGDRRQFQLINEAYEQMMREAKKRPVRSESTANSPVSPRDQVANPWHPPMTPPQHSKPRPTKRKDGPKESFWSFVTRKLPLQDETAYFILVNALDIFLTYLILRNEGTEANPIANFFYRIGNIQGMVAFKMVIVAFVCVVAQVVALRSIRTAKRLLWLGIIAIGFVVFYSIILLARIQ